MRVLSEQAVDGLLSLSDLAQVVEEAFIAQGRGLVERPERPHFPVGEGLDGRESPAGTGLTMPAYIHGDPAFATKLVAVHEANVDRGLPTVHAQIVLTDAATGQPLALLAGSDVTNARTGCIGGLAVRELATTSDRGDLTLAVLGAGAQARWQTRAIGTIAELDSVRVYSPRTREACAADLREEGYAAKAVGSPRAAVEGAEVVVTATTSHEPVFPGDALATGALVIAVGAYTPEMCELDEETFDRADQVFGDVPEEVATIGDICENGIDPGRITPLSEVFERRAGRATADEIIVVESVGSAVFDTAAANHLYRQATEDDVGQTVGL